LGGADIKGDLREALFVSGDEVSQHWHLMDQPKGERGEVISAVLGSRDDKDVLLWVKKELVDNKSGADP
jgi:hypothetical protein